MKHLQLALMALALFAFALGCDDDDSGGGNGSDNGNGEGESGELGWALDIAKAETPFDDLFWLWGTDVDADGRIGEEGGWVFFFMDLGGSKQDSFQVVVFSDGSINTELWEEGEFEHIDAKLPEYRDASSWVAAADSEVTGLDFSYRTLTISPDQENEAPGSTNICWAQYLSETAVLQAMVLLDADTDEVLDSMIMEE